MRLNHYSSPLHLKSILESGVLRPTESNIGSPMPLLEPFGEHVGPDVVWFTVGSPMRAGLEGSIGNKGSLVVVVEVPDADVHHWPAWAKKHGIHPLWFEALAQGWNQPDEWYVVERIVPSSEWVEILELADNTPGSQVFRRIWPKQ